MNVQLQQLTKSNCAILLVGLIGGYLCVLTTPAIAETTVTNSVRVEANGSGESHASVKTVINGVVVEDWEETSLDPILYSHIATGTESSTSISVSATDQSSTSQPERDRLVELIARLQALIALYVSLLTH
ncbi:MAG: hypothetical protein KBC35_00130 [Candidatus Pacebacteria bacterium]|jgi:hypothetical protein|nr:hypothetical protein [Candidatus Paceibacterota bacterium]